MMKTRIAIGASLLLALGTALAGTLIYRTDASLELNGATAAPSAQEPTPEMIAVWKATARSSDYIAARVPL